MKPTKPTTRRTTKPTVPATTTTTTVPAATIAPALTFAAFGVDVPNPPRAIMAFVDAFRAVHTMPVATPDDRRAVADAITRVMESAMPNTPTVPANVRNTGRFTGFGVFDAQNAMYVAAALSNVPVSVGMMCAAWRAELPNAKCDYIGRAFDRAYPRTTLSEYVNGRHGTVANVSGARAIVAARRSAGNGPLFMHGTNPADVKPIDA